MTHEVLPDRLMLHVNQAQYLYYKNVSKIRTWCYLHCHNVTRVTLVLHIC